jgi:DNA repair protein RAD16
LENVWTDLERLEKVDPEPIEQPSFLNLSLLPFQKVGVAWMIQQEKNPDVSYN